MTPTRMPSLYVPHGGGPCFFMDWDPADEWDSLAAYLRGISQTMPQRPSAILMVTAHWMEADFAVSSAERPGMLYDYSGFPRHTYELQYPAPGHPALAQRVCGLLGDAGLKAHLDAERGYDHGTFVPLLLMYPDADIPVVQLSLRLSLDARAHLEAGQALAPLRDEGVLIVGSGMSFHNMRAYRDPRFTPVSQAFDDWLAQTVALPTPERISALAQWDQAPYARLCHPPRAEEHLLPLMVAAGAAGSDAGRRVFSDVVMKTHVSGIQFG